MALVATQVSEVYDFHSERFARSLWVNGAPILPYVEVRAAKLEARAKSLGAARSSASGMRLRLGYNVETYEAEERLKAAKKNALSAKLEPPPRKDVYVKGAQEWEKNMWKVWDKKKMQEEQRRDKYSNAMVSYVAGHKLVGRFEPPAVTQCAHCDIGGGLHPLRRCMGCMAVAYCCRMHQKKHWEWHKHICFAIRAANNLEAKRGEGAGWVKLRPRRWRRPPIENGAIVETNTRARWANWKQFYTNGAQSMLNQMGDGGPFVFKEWDEAVASMAMCEEATFVFSVGATQRAMMPFVACRKAPMGTVLVCEVGLINVKRNGGRDQEVNDFLTAKFVAEARQKKLDRLDEQKFMRLRMANDRKDKSDQAMKLLKHTLDGTASADALAEQKDDGEFGAEDAGNEPSALAAAATVLAPEATGSEPAVAASSTSSSPAKATAASERAAAKPAAMPTIAADDVEEWDEEPAHDYEAFGGEGEDDFFALPGDGSEAPLNMPSAFDDVPDEAFFDDAGRFKAPALPPAAALPGGSDDAAPHFNAQESIAKLPPFVPAPAFDGARVGYVFKQGDRGLGFYLDSASASAPWEDSKNIPSFGLGDNLGSAPWDISDASSGIRANGTPRGLSAPAPKVNDPWASVDSVDTSQTRVNDAIAAQKHQLEAAKAAAERMKRERAAKAAGAGEGATQSAALTAPKAGVGAAATSSSGAAAAAIGAEARDSDGVGTIKQLLDRLGLGDKLAAFKAAGMTDPHKLASLHRSDPTALTSELTKIGLKMGQRQKVILALDEKLG